MAAPRSSGGAQGTAGVDAPPLTLPSPYSGTRERISSNFSPAGG
jgi:hypothetical protein